MKTNIRIYCKGNKSIFPNDQKLDGQVEFVVILNDDDRESSWLNPQCGDTFLATKENYQEKCIQALGEGGFFPYKWDSMFN